MDINRDNGDNYNLTRLFHKKFDEYSQSLRANSFIFEVTKNCGYSMFVIVYKEESLLDLYKRVSLQFGVMEIRELYYINKNNNRKMLMPLTQLLKVKDFMRELINSTPRIVEPIYPVNCLEVYKLYIDDGYYRTEYALNT